VQDEAQLRPVGVCSNVLYANENIKMANPRMEIKPNIVRAIVNNITQDLKCSITMYVDNRKSVIGERVKDILFEPPVIPSNDPYKLLDIDTKLYNAMWSLPNCEQGWKCFPIIKWNNGSLTQFSIELTNLLPMNPLKSQVPNQKRVVDITTDVFTNQVH
jgi:hypothetical protein